MLLDHYFLTGRIIIRTLPQLLILILILIQLIALIKDIPKALEPKQAYRLHAATPRGSGQWET